MGRMTTSIQAGFPKKGYQYYNANQTDKADQFARMILCNMDKISELFYAVRHGRQMTTMPDGRTVKIADTISSFGPTQQNGQTWCFRFQFFGPINGSNNVIISKSYNAQQLFFLYLLADKISSTSVGFRRRTIIDFQATFNQLLKEECFNYLYWALYAPPLNRQAHPEPLPSAQLCLDESDKIVLSLLFQEKAIVKFYRDCARAQNYVSTNRYFCTYFNYFNCIFNDDLTKVTLELLKKKYEGRNLIELYIGAGSCFNRTYPLFKAPNWGRGNGPLCVNLP
jgi:hypothetical protein